MRPSIKTIAINASVVTALVGGGVAYMTFNNAVALTVDGETETVHTFAGSVGDVLDAQGIEVSPRDEVVPSVDSTVDDGTEITVRHGREVSVTVDGVEKTFWTTALSVDEALSELGIRDEGADLSVARSRDIDRSGLDFEVRTPKDITVVADGEEEELTTTALTVREVLADSEVELEDRDIVEPSLDTTLSDEDEVVVKRVTVETETVEVELDYDTKREEDDSLTEGVTTVETEGETGLMERKVEKTYIDGELEDEETLSEEVVAEPVDEVVLVGTKPEEPNEPEEDDDGGGDNVDGGVWDRLAQCESGGDWSINTGNGYYGGLQFSLQTWRAYGGSGYPHENSKAEQIRIAEKVRDARGHYGDWPACARKLGLPTS
ncbi:resuscitation-promoting factor [Actinobacteria bacterium YIM 96077]|uniref:Resuscitation-promoting factor n=1 Tax=Phytoactinopolyspora halophila TaxID=1981511 RepID=A0A329QH14_9ACTN|nr:resuscitation-promoting factor [Phytoactinopolyspora halophila]AYY14484.1 resuscitation-promoting factor [Actinobacteria bacterium YIM 96077]RAW11476.1 resuscitation-promoting factor [Phytoactinopolyspora halophila]